MKIYDFLASAPLSDASGFTTKYVNTDEERVKKGIEITAGLTPVKTSNWKWDINFNWSKDATFYSKLDEQYSPDELWVNEGARVDAYTTSDWMRDPAGNLINNNGPCKDSLRRRKLRACLSDRYRAELIFGKRPT